MERDGRLIDSRDKHRLDRRTVDFLLYEDKRELSRRGAPIDDRTAIVMLHWRERDPYDERIPYSVDTQPEIRSYERVHYARSPESETWVELSDLPEETRQRLVAWIQSQPDPIYPPFDEGNGEDLPSKDEVIEQVLETRRSEGKRIDPETAEVASWYIHQHDPYRLHQHDYFNWNPCRGYFARQPGSKVWVAFGDLPPATIKALEERYKCRMEFPTALPWIGPRISG